MESGESKRLKPSLSEILFSEAQTAGIPLYGAVDISLAEPYLKEHFSRYSKWLNQGFAGAMSYLERGYERRTQPHLLLPGAKSVFSVAIPYSTRPSGLTDPREGVRYARYIYGDDYHDRIQDLLQALMEKTAARWKDVFPERELRWKVCVDTSAVLERSWAALCGLGWIGKNTLLINPQYGSYLFLGEVFLSEEVHLAPKILPNYCGSCERCIQKCPTEAIVESGWVDSRKCISYATLEKRGDWPLNPEQSKAAGTWVAGCDLCQEVCPFNTKAVKRDQSEPSPLPSDWMSLLSEDEAAYRGRIKKSALNRVKPPQFRRNVARALWQALETLERVEAQALAFKVKDQVLRHLREENHPEVLEQWNRTLSVIKSLGNESDSLDHQGN